MRIDECSKIYMTGRKSYFTGKCLKGWVGFHYTAQWFEFKAEFVKKRMDLFDFERKKLTQLKPDSNHGKE